MLLQAVVEAVSRVGDSGQSFASVGGREEGEEGRREGRADSRVGP